MRANPNRLIYTTFTMSTEGNNNSNSAGNGASKAKKPRDVIKKENEEKQAGKNLVDCTELVLESVNNNPSLLEKESFINIRKLLRDISTKHGGSLLPPSGWGLEWGDLTKDIARNLRNRELTTPLENDIFLQITHRDSVEVKNGSIGVNGHSRNIETRRKWRFTAVDGSNDALLLRIDSTLNTAAMSLNPGSIAKITSFFPVYFNYGDDNDNRCAIVLRDFEIVGRRGIPEDLLSGGRNNKKASTQEKRKAENVSSTCSQNNPSGPEKPFCNGNLCSIHGVKFELCLRDIIPPAEVPLALVARDCVFTTMELKDMENNHRRFLLYYYYATTIYQFHGSGNRVDLPVCIIHAIRELWPKETVDMSHM